MKIKKGDNVFIIAGKDKGKTGIVEKVLPAKDRIVVTGVNICKKHLKPSKKNPHGGILNMAKPISASNVMLSCPHCGKPVKIAVKITDKTKERICRKCSGNLDASTGSMQAVKEKNVKS